MVSLVMSYKPKKTVANKDEKVHADATNFSPNLTKPEAYQQLLDEVEGLCYEQRNWVW